MTNPTDNTIRRELLLENTPAEVWQALTDPATLAQWMFPNNFQPLLHHKFTFQVPGNPKLNFPGLTVHCQVLECSPPSRLVFSWSVPGPVENTTVSYELIPEGAATRLLFQHTGFNLAHPYAMPAFKGAAAGWKNMHEKLTTLLKPRSPQ